MGDARYRLRRALLGIALGLVALTVRLTTGKGVRHG